MKILSLLGGGIDSTTLTLYMKEQGHDVTAFWVDYGQVAAVREHRWSLEFCKEHGIGFEVADLNLRMGESSILNPETDKNDRAKNVLDGRNAVLLSLAACHAANYGYDAIAIGYHHEPDKTFPDACIPFFEQYSTLMQVGLVNRVQLLAPFRALLRDEVFILADSMSRDIVDNAYTCYDDVYKGCGKCSHCIQKANYVRLVHDNSTLDRIRTRIYL